MNDAGDCGQGTDGVGNVIGAVGEGHGAGGENHQYAEYSLDAGEVKSAFLSGLQLYSSEHENATDHHHQANTDGIDCTLGKSNFHT